MATMQSTVEQQGTTIGELGDTIKRQDATIEQLRAEKDRGQAQARKASGGQQMSLQVEQDGCGTNPSGASQILQEFEGRCRT